ncbi:MAG: penicillin-binding protein activator [Magnetococcus sp. DMHC-6]
MNSNLFYFINKIQTNKTFYPVWRMLGWLLLLYIILSAPLLAANPTLDDRSSSTEAIAWENLLKSYFKTDPAQQTQAFSPLFESTPLSTEQIRLLLQSASFLNREQLQTFLTHQPPKSPLIPGLKLSVADKLIQEGEPNAAHALWQEVANHPEESAEAATLAKLHLGTEENPAPDFRVGLLLPLTGSYAAIGQDFLRSAQNALSDHADIAITLIPVDTAGDIKVGTQAMERLIRMDVHAILGPFIYPVAKATVGIALDRGIPIFPFNPHTDLADIEPKGERFLFLNAFLPDQQARLIAQYAIKKTPSRRFATLAPNTDYGNLMAEAFLQEIQKLGGQVIRRIAFPADTVDFSNTLKELTRIDPKKATVATAKESTDFDALFIPASADKIRLLASQLAFYNIRPPQVALFGTSLWNRSELLTSDAEYLQGAIFCDTDPVADGQFQKNFTTTWGRPPNPLASLAYDGIAILAQLLHDHRMGGPPWEEAISRPQGFQGATGWMRFLNNGLSERQYHFFKIDQSAITQLDPQPRDLISFEPPEPDSLEQLLAPKTNKGYP